MTDMLSNYLDQVDRDLDSLSLSERTTLLKELKANLLERIDAGESPQEALEHLGAPDQVAALLEKAMLQKENLSASDMRLIWSLAIMAALFVALAGVALYADLTHGSVWAGLSICGWITFAFCLSMIILALVKEIHE